MKDADVIVIGSGAGGLAGALALARAGKKVLVLEQHEVPGGWCHSFMLGGHRFSPGVHYIGELGPEGHMRRIYEGLGVAGDMSFMQLNPDGYEHVLVGNERFDIPASREGFEARLSERFPNERSGIRGYLNDVSKISEELRLPMRKTGPLGSLMTPLRMRTLLTRGIGSLEGLIGRHVQDDLLKTILAIQCGDHGLPPSRVPAALHAAIAGHYFEGGYYPKGGGFTIPRAFVRGLKRAGGALRTNTSVSRILIEGGRAVGVRLEDGSELRADVVLSNADPAMTYGKLVGPEHLGGRLRRRIDKTRYSIAALSLFFAVDMDLAKKGYDSGNYWITGQPDLERAYRQEHDPGRLAADGFDSGFLTVTTLKDRSKQRGKTHTLEAFTFISNEAFSKWQQSKYEARPAAYEDLKARLTDRMFEVVERAIPGVRDHVTFSNLGTPLTNSHYVRATAGSLYGTEKTLRNVGPLAYSTKSEIPGLYLCGASTVGHGVAGATMSGLEAAKRILGCRMREILVPQGPSLETYLADAPETWPESMRARLHEDGYEADARPQDRAESQNAA